MNSVNKNITPKFRLMRHLFFFVLVMISACSTTRYGLTTRYMVDVKDHDIDGKLIPLSSRRLLTKRGAMELQKKSIAELTVSDADSPLVLLHGNLPRYPVRLWTRKIEGVVEISFIIDEKGIVRNPQVVSSTNRLLTNVCIRSVSKWRFQPISKAGVPIQVQAKQKFPFRIIR